MSRVTHVQVRGKDVPVHSVHRMEFKDVRPHAYNCLENGNRPIPGRFYLDREDQNRVFLIEEGLIPLVLVWTGNRWMKVKP